MPKWEYMTETWWVYYEDFIYWLNAYGEGGWELIQVTESHSEDYKECIFKRKIKN